MADGSWEVRWHPSAVEEKDSIVDATERSAIQHAIEKLVVDGPALCNPHQRAVMGPGGAGLRELRPRRGRSRWRPLYRRFGDTLFVILAVAPEAELDKPGFGKRVRDAQRRRKQVEKALAENPEIDGT
jgi:hypothetical protein